MVQLILHIYLVNYIVRCFDVFVDILEIGWGQNKVNMSKYR